MKNYHFLLMACVLTGLSACTRLADKAVSGIYVTRFTNEYSHADDTLIVSALSLTDHTYTVERHSGFNKIRDGKVLPREYKIQHWTAIYNPANAVLEESAMGRKLFLKADSQQIVSGSMTYHKIPGP